MQLVDNGEERKIKTNKWRDYFYCNHIEHRLKNKGQPQRISRKMFEDKKCINKNWEVCRHLVISQNNNQKNKKKHKGESRCFLCHGTKDLMNLHVIPPSLKPKRNRTIQICKNCNKLLQQYNIDLYRKKYDKERKELEQENTLLQQQNKKLKKKYEKLIKEILENN